MASNFAQPPNDDVHTITIPSDFAIQPVDGAFALQDDGIETTPDGLPTDFPDLPPAEGSLGIALSQFKGKFRGKGLNMIFRPRNTPSTKAGKDSIDDPFTQEKFPNETGQTEPAKPQILKDNILEYNLTEEKLSFLGSSILKNVPNRGFKNQPHVNLQGTPYIQTVTNVLDPSTGKADSSLKTDIHFEPGLFMRTPETVDPALPATISRMASIPHGTTINAQGIDPTEADRQLGNPNDHAFNDRQGIEIRDGPTIPFRIDEPGSKVDLFDNLTYEGPQRFRLPQSFADDSPITKEVFFEPNHLLVENNKKKTIVDYIKFKVSTRPWEAFNEKLTTTSVENKRGGGTSNIAFLAEKSQPVTDQAQPDNELEAFNPTSNRPPTGSTSNANAANMEATFWISTVRHEIIIPPWREGLTLPLCAPIDTDPDVQGPRLFRVKPNRAVTKPTRVFVHSTQIQYSQLVLLDFGPLSWPHISVATLVPDDTNDCDILTVEVDVDQSEIVIGS